MKSGRGREGTAKEDDFLVDPETRDPCARIITNATRLIPSLEEEGEARERGVSGGKQWIR